MRSRMAANLSFLVWVLLTFPLFALGDSGGGNPKQAVTYVEFPDNGKMVNGGRTLTMDGVIQGRQVGIDINSSVTMKIDEDALQAALAPYIESHQQDPVLREALAVLSDLGLAAEHIKDFPAVFQKESEEYAELQRIDSDADLAQQVRAFNRSSRNRANLWAEIIEPLFNAKTRRLASAFGTEDEAEFEAARQLGPVYATERGYDLDALGELFAEEIRFSEKEVADRSAELAEEGGQSVEILARLFRQDDSHQGVLLPGHNEEDAGSEIRYKKIDFEWSEEEQELYAGYEALAEEVKKAKGTGDKLLKILEVSLEAEIAPLKEAAGAAKAAATEAEQQVRTLLDWADADRLRTWVSEDAVAQILSNSAVNPSWVKFEEAIMATRQDFEFLRSFGDLEASIGRLSPPDALRSILAVLTRDQNSPGARILRPQVWKARLATGEEFIRALGQANLLESLRQIDGPVRAWFDAKDGLQTVADSLEGVSEEARRLFARLKGGGAAPLAADLRLPKGQKRRPLSDDLDSEFNLRTIKGEREPGDRVELQFKFYDGEEQIIGGGWTDRFDIRVFGWQGKSLAALAFTRRVDPAAGEDWEPTAVASALVHFRKWPGAKDTGLKGGNGHMFGFGLSTMPLDFDEQESVELGVAGTISLFNDWVQIGYGTNLQVSDNGEFYFFSIRVFQLSGMFSPAKKP